MSEHIKESMSKGEHEDATAYSALTRKTHEYRTELRHGEWITTARKARKLNRFTNPVFVLLIVFAALFVGSAYLFESLEILTTPCTRPRSSLTACVQ